MRYEKICAGRPGSEGSRLRDVPPISNTARQRPYEVLHKLTTAIPTKMPALRTLVQQLLGDILPHLRGLPETR